MTKKQYYIPGKEYEWTKETWDTVLEHVESIMADCYGPFATETERVKGSTEYEHGGASYTGSLDNLCWEFVGNEKYWRFSVSEEGVEIPEYLIPFYGEGKKEILTVNDLEAGKEYIMCLGVNEEQHIIYWAKNQEVIFITNLLYHTYEHAFIKGVCHFREVPEKTCEQELSEKYNVSVDTIKKMIEDGVIK